jgi:glycine/D-amino acid oxidase-like deaminating enzyme
MATASAHRELRALSCAALGVPPWHPPAPPARVSLPSSCDVAIVGGGLTGAFLASILARPERRVVVLEQAFGAGASARSGGIVLGETVAGPSPEFRGCEESLREWILTRAVACELAWNGCLELVRNEALPAEPVDWRDAGTIRVLRRVNGGVLDPALLLSGAMGDACRAGAQLVNGVASESFNRDANGVSVTTTAGIMRTRFLVMATDAMLAPASGAADPWDERGVTVAMQTMPLDDSEISALGLTPNLAFYTDDVPLLWGRVMPDQSLLIGREMAATTSDAPPSAQSTAVSVAGARLLERVRGLHPALGHVGLKRVWGGPIVRTKAGIPVVVPDAAIPHVTWVGGYGGHGIAQALRVAQLAAKDLM